MFTKEWVVEYQGNKIVVRNSWGPTLSLKSFTGEAKLYINGAKVDTCTDLFNFPNRPAMRGNVKLDDSSFKEVEIFMKSGLLTVKAKICVDGIKIGGDDF